MRRLSTILAALALALGLAVGAPAAAHADNSAVAINTKDGSSVFRFAFAIKHVMSPIVDESNAAVAYASCTDCHTTAIAIEIVLVEGNPTTFTPQNVAIAINFECTLCDTFAAAYQFVVQGSGPMHFTHQALRELHDVRQEIRRLERENLDPFQLQAALDPLIQRIQSALATGLVSGPPDESDQDDEDQSDNGRGPPSNPGDTTETSTGPAATATLPSTTSTGTDTTQTTTTEPSTTDTTPTTTAPATTTAPTDTTTTTTTTDTTTTTP